MAFDYTFKSLKKVMSVSIAPDSYKLGGISASDYATNTYLNSNFIKGLSADGTTLTITKGDNSTSSITVNVSDGDILPSQANNSGKFLTTNGTTVSWGTPTDTTYTQGTGITITGTTISANDQLPSRTGKSGQYLTTDGTNVSWGLAVVHPSEKCVLNNNASGTITLDIDDAVIYSLNMTGNSSIVISKDSTLDVYSTNRSATITLLIKNGGSYILNWPSNLNWADSIAPTLSINNKYDVITLITFDSGTTWLGLSTGSNYTLS